MSAFVRVSMAKWLGHKGVTILGYWDGWVEAQLLKKGQGLVLLWSCHWGRVRELMAWRGNEFAESKDSKRKKKLGQINLRKIIVLNTRLSSYCLSRINEPFQLLPVLCGFELQSIVLVQAKTMDNWRVTSVSSVLGICDSFNCNELWPQKQNFTNEILHRQSGNTNWGIKSLALVNELQHYLSCLFTSPLIESESVS